MSDGDTIELLDGKGHIWSRSKPDAEEWARWGGEYQLYFLWHGQPEAAMSFEAFALLRHREAQAEAMALDLQKG